MSLDGSQQDLRRQISEQARDRFPGTIVIGQVWWPDYGANPNPSKDEKQAMRDRAGGLPPTVMLVVTLDHVFACPYRPSHRGITLEDDVKAWPRDQLRSSVSYPYGGDEYARVGLVAPSGRVELDAPDAKGLNAGLVAVLSR